MVVLHPGEDAKIPVHRLEDISEDDVESNSEAGDPEDEESRLKLAEQRRSASYFLLEKSRSTARRAKGDSPTEIVSYVQELVGTAQRRAHEGKAAEVHGLQRSALDQCRRLEAASAVQETQSSPEAV